MKSPIKMAAKPGPDNKGKVGNWITDTQKIFFSAIQKHSREVIYLVGCIDTDHSWLRCSQKLKCSR